MIEVSSCVWISSKNIDKQLLDSLLVRNELITGKIEYIKAWREDRKGYIGIPRVYGLKLISNFKDLRSKGRSTNLHITHDPRDYQVDVLEELYQAALSKKDFVFKALTGSGKTYLALNLATRLQRTTLVVVDQEFLMDQWVDRCIEHLGLSKDDIGIIQGDICNYKNKPITIAMVQSLVRREYEPSLYDYHGLVYFDESHTAGAPVYSKVLMMFNAEIRIGLSAIPDRRDALNQIIKWNIGEVEVELKSEHKKSLLYILESDGVYSYSSNNSKISGRFINELVADGKRNLLISQAIKWLYDSGRDVLVIGDRVEHLQNLMSLSCALGVPENDAILLTKKAVQYRIMKDNFPTSRPEGYEKGTMYCPISLKLRNTETEREAKRKYLVDVKNTKRIIFSTYGMFGKGVDIPRLSAGIDCTPRSQATNVIGRILRIQLDKLIPIWVTIADKNSFRSLYMLSNRMPEYVNSNVMSYLWNPYLKGRKLLQPDTFVAALRKRVRYLRLAKITISRDGRGTVQTLNSRSTVNSSP